MKAERMDERLRRYMDEAVSAGRFDSRAAILKEAKLSSGYLGELAQRCSADPSATMHHTTARRIGAVLGVSPDELLHVDSPPAEDRTAAVTAARYLKLPESAIRAVLDEPYSPGLGAMYWFRRIESEAERRAPAADLSSKRA